MPTSSKAGTSRSYEGSSLQTNQANINTCPGKYQTNCFLAYENTCLTISAPLSSFSAMVSGEYFLPLLAASVFTTA